MPNPTEQALKLLKYLPRISLNNLVKSPYAEKRRMLRGKQYRKRYPINKSNLERQRYFPVGYSPDEHWNQWYMKIPREHYYKNIRMRRQYPPLSLFDLQFLIDSGMIDPEEPIDLATICRTNHYAIDPLNGHFGVHLTDEGANVFKAKVNIEVQYAKEPVIAAIERNGGVISTAYYDVTSVIALKDPFDFFSKGGPIPRRKLPPEDAVGYYTDPKSRGYLADPEKVAEERYLLSQKYGYVLPNIDSDPSSKILKLRKDPRQVFFGLEPGWVVNLKDKEILQPTNELLLEYYKS